MKAKLKTFSFCNQEVLNHLEKIKRTYGNESKYISDLIYRDMKNNKPIEIEEKIKQIVEDCIKKQYNQINIILFLYYYSCIW